ncbi:hypothetical protein BTTOUR_10500 [Bacillus thuringiensis serovar toumanoffi]|uniref:Spermidine/putrescine ABC transporter ATP-binding protein n=1 Tax=Bacillus thuringiensis serovar toumanoffi TaxID=180862 RepID=A0ABD5HW22_BACTU|nr:hypothetical protein [Bacillus thuringiensis serovar toumanoffi]SEF84792.1 hypothetical protein SAMN04487919_103269 [Bacillus sp. ok061]
MFMSSYCICKFVRWGNSVYSVDMKFLKRNDTKMKTSLMRGGSRLGRKSSS